TIIANVPVRNEAWILELCLAALDRIADVIIVADQQSSDETPTICAKFAKVVRLENPGQSYDEQARYQLLLSASRDWSGSNLILTIDADEVFTGDVLDPDLLRDISDRIAPGASAECQWIWLWKRFDRYRTGHRPFSDSWKFCAFRDDRQMTFEPGV